jgi:hypothetical protein
MECLLPLYRLTAGSLHMINYGAALGIIRTGAGLFVKDSTGNGNAYSESGEGLATFAFPVAVMMTSKEHSFT